MRLLNSLFILPRDPNDEGGGGGAPEETVDTLRAKVADLTAQLTEAKKGGADATTANEVKLLRKQVKALTTERDAAKSELATLQTEHAEVTTKAALRDVGITDADDQEFALLKYGKFTPDEGEEKPTLSEFLADAKKSKAAWFTRIAMPAAAPARPAKKEPVATAAIEDEEPAPAPARPAPAPAPAAAAPAPAAAEPAPRPKPAESNGAKTVVRAAATSSELTADQIRALSPAEYKKHRASIRGSLGLPVAPTPAS